MTYSAKICTACGREGHTASACESALWAITEKNRHLAHPKSKPPPKPAPEPEIDDDDIFWGY